jgi:transposase
MKTETILGIDVAKTKFDACLKLGSGHIREKIFSNDAQGIAQLLQWLEQQTAGAVRVGIEATGCYWVSLAHQLYTGKHTVCLLNPAYVKYYAQSLGARSKTDRVDARLIAEYVGKNQCESWDPLPVELEQLRELMRLYADVTALAASAGQRSEGLRTSLARKFQTQVTASLKKFAGQILKAAHTHAKAHPSLRQPLEHLDSIKGVATITALIWTAELPRGRAARSVAGWAGLTPRHFESGTTVFKRPRLCKQGSDYIRQSLYWPAITALRHDPAMRRFGQRLEQEGLHKMQIIGAAMHKLLRWAVGVLNTGKPFDPSLHAQT